jgi:putative spermidine/putrescine transport system permease protein
MAAVAPVSGIGTAVAEQTPQPRRTLRASRRLKLNLFRWAVFAVATLFFLVPLLSMVRFSFEGDQPGTYTISAWTQIISYPGLLSAIEITLELAVITVCVELALLVPTMIWVKLRVQWLSRTIEFLCLLPLTIPAIVLVVGLVPIYRGLREHVSLSALQLFWVYVILAMPYAYRALSAGLDAIDVRTLAEAARSLGASWFTVMVRVIAPNIRQALLNAMLLSIALVLGEFTVASILLYTNLQVALYEISQATLNAGVLFATSAAALLFAFLLLLTLSYVGRRRDRERR